MCREFPEEFFQDRPLPVCMTTTVLFKPWRIKCAKTFLIIRLGGLLLISKLRLDLVSSQMDIFHAQFHTICIGKHLFPILLYNQIFWDLLRPLLFYHLQIGQSSPQVFIFRKMYNNILGSGTTNSIPLFVDWGHSNLANRELEFPSKHFAKQFAKWYKTLNFYIVLILLYILDEKMNQKDQQHLWFTPNRQEAV